MTEAEILTVRNDLTAIVISIVSVGLTIVSAYIVGLWMFLRRAPFAVRTLAFAVLTCGLLFIGALTSGVHELLLGTERAWEKLGKNSVEIHGFGSDAPHFLMGLTAHEAVAALGAFAFVVIYIALFFLTFFYRWRADVGSE